MRCRLGRHTVFNCNYDATVRYRTKNSINQHETIDDTNNLNIAQFIDELPFDTSHPRIEKKTYPSPCSRDPAIFLTPFVFIPCLSVHTLRAVRSNADRNSSLRIISHVLYRRVSLRHKHT